MRVKKDNVEQIKSEIMRILQLFVIVFLSCFIAFVIQQEYTQFMDDVKLDVITTKYGDKGKTNLVDIDVSKSDQIMELIGSIDEANAAIGFAMFAVSTNLHILRKVQNSLFDLAADIISEAQGKKNLQITEEQISELQDQINKINAQLPGLTSFVIPKGRSSPMHLARTIVRRAERCFWRYREERVDANELPGVYLNRLSDLLFVVCRYIHNRIDEEELWVRESNNGKDGGKESFEGLSDNRFDGGNND